MVLHLSDVKLSKPPVLSPKPSSEQLVKRFSFNRSKANETSSSPAAPAQRSDGPVAKVQANGSDIAAPTFLKPSVTSTPISGSSLVRRISAEYNSKIVAEEKPTAVFPSRAKPWLPNSPSTVLEQDKTSAADTKVVKSASENSFKSSTFVASLLAPDAQEKSTTASSSSEHAFKLGSIEKSEVTRRFPESAPPREETNSMKSLFASLEPSECKRVEEEFERLTNETAVDVQDPDAKLEEILSEEGTGSQNKKVGGLVAFLVNKRTRKVAILADGQHFLFLHGEKPISYSIYCPRAEGNKLV